MALDIGWRKVAVAQNLVNAIIMVAIHRAVGFLGLLRLASIVQAHCPFPACQEPIEFQKPIRKVRGIEPDG